MKVKGKKKANKVKAVKKHLKEDMKMFKKETKEDKSLLKKLGNKLGY